MMGRAPAPDAAHRQPNPRPSGPTGDGQSRRARPRRTPPSDRRGRHRHRQDAGLPAARLAHRPAHHHLHRHQGSAGSALLSRCALPGNAGWRAARLLYERPRQLSLPPQAHGAAQPANFVRIRRDRPISPDLRVGADYRIRRPRGVIRAARVERLVAKARREDRGLPGVNLSGLPPLLHYRDAAQGA